MSSTRIKAEGEISGVHYEKQYGKIKFSGEILRKVLCPGLLILQRDKID